MSTIRSRPKASAGFGLVEIMVAVLIGMFGVIAVMNIYANSEAQKRTTTGLGDAQTNGAIALDSLQRDIRQSGWGSVGANNLELIGCNVQLPVGVTLNAMAPVTINHPSIPNGVADAGTDTLLVVYGNGNGAAEGDGIIGQGAANTYTVQTPTAFAAGDYVIAAPQQRQAQCNLVLDQIAAINGSIVTVRTGTAVGSMVNGRLYDLGPAPKVLAYAVYNGNLTVCDYMQNDCGSANNVGNPRAWVPIASNIVSLRAEYGRVAGVTTKPMTLIPPSSTVVDTWDQSTPTANAPGPIIQCGWLRIPSVRLALVARSEQYEKTALTVNNNPPSWLGSVATPANAHPPSNVATPINLSGIANWQNYRYKLFQTVAPIRTIVWTMLAAGAALQC